MCGKKVQNYTKTEQVTSAIFPLLDFYQFEKSLSSALVQGVQMMQASNGKYHYTWVDSRFYENRPFGKPNKYFVKTDLKVLNMMDNFYESKNNDSIH